MLRTGLRLYQWLAGPAGLSATRWCGRRGSGARTRRGARGSARRRSLLGRGLDDGAPRESPSLADAAAHAPRSTPYTEVLGAAPARTEHRGGRGGPARGGGDARSAAGRGERGGSVGGRGAVAHSRSLAPAFPRPPSRCSGLARRPPSWFPRLTAVTGPARRTAPVTGAVFFVVPPGDIRDGGHDRGRGGPRPRPARPQRRAF